MFLLTLKPYPDETLSSLLFRVAKENMMDNLYWIISNLNQHLNSNINVNSINWLTNEELEQVANLLSITHTEAENLTLLPLINQLDVKMNCYEKNSWFLYVRVKYCPICIQENIYHKRTWASCHSLICQSHNCLLIDTCQKCSKKIDMKGLINNKCSKCNIELSTVNSIPISSNKLKKYQSLIDSTFNPSSFFYSHPWIKNLSTFLSALEFFGSWVIRILDSDDLSIEELEIKHDGSALERNHLKNSKSVDQSLCIYSYAFKVLDDWPLEFFKFLSKAEILKKKHFSYFVHHVIPSIIGTCLEEFSIQFTNYLAFEKMNLASDVNYIRSDEIKFFTDRFNSSIVHLDSLSSFKINYLGQDLFLLNADDFKLFLKKYENGLTKEDLKKRWGTSSKATYSFLNNNLFNQMVYLENGSSNTWVVPIKTIEYLEKQLSSLSKPITYKYMLFNKVIEWIGPENGNILLKGILNKNIKFSFSGAKLSEAKVSKNDTYIYIKEAFLKRGLINGFLTYKELTFILGVKKSDIIHWVKTNRFGKFDSQLSDTIPILSYQLFSKNYLTTLELSLKFNLNIKQVLKKSKLGKFNSVSGPQMKDGKRLLFKSEDFD